MECPVPQVEQTRCGPVGAAGVARRGVARLDRVRLDVARRSLAGAGIVMLVCAWSAGIPSIVDRLVARPVSAQAAPQPVPGRASFRVYEQGRSIGDVHMTLEPTEDGWRLHGTSRLAGTAPQTVQRLDLYYGPGWHGRFMTLEMTAPDPLVVHVAVAGTTTRTDITQDGRVRFRSSSVSPDTIFLPDRAFGAYEAMAARVQGSAAGTSVPIFLAPDVEVRAVVERVTVERVRTDAGPLEATRYRLTEWRGAPVPVDVWTDRGRLLRLDIPRWGITMLRDDVR